MTLGEQAKKFQEHLAAVKSYTPLDPRVTWYPWQTLGQIQVLDGFLQGDTSALMNMIGRDAALDVGCGDGDIAFFLESLGARIDAIDQAPTNYNALLGVHALKQALGSAIRIHAVDLDTRPQLPSFTYGFTVMLGVLYHLKNPFYVLETIAARADWCVLSTRIAQVTPAHRTRIEDEPVAYLLGAREANHDPTNYWIFSSAGLLRLLERTGWIVMGHRRVGCAIDSDPVRAESDERLIVIVKSRTRHPGLHVRLLEGWHATERATEHDAFRWTAKRFAMEVTLPERAHEFALRFSVTEALCGSGAVRVSCAISGHPAGSITCESPGTIEFRGRFPFETITHRLDFTVESEFQPPGDMRELGICIPLLEDSPRHTERIPFRIS